MDGEGKQLSNKVYRNEHWIWIGVTKKTKNWHGFFEINSLSWTSVHGFFFVTCIIELYRNDLKGSKNNFELAGGLSYRGFELPRVKLQ